MADTITVTAQEVQLCFPMRRMHGAVMRPRPKEKPKTGRTRNTATMRTSTWTHLTVSGTNKLFRFLLSLL